SCNGGTNGSATVTATGGTGAYTYAWSPSGGTAATATGLSAGAYSVLITDANGCTLTKNVTITQPAAITIGMTKTSVVCNGEGNGTATANAAGGTGPYTYSWSPAGGTAATATGLAAGVYTVFVTDANGCTATRNVTIVQPTALTATTSQVNILCNEGTTGAATVTATGGTGAYTYAWSPSGGTSATANGLVAGTYSVVVTDANGCTVTQSVTITQTSAITATTSKTNVSCNGGSNGSATVVAAGGAGDYTYLWSPSGGTAATATGLASGTYTVTITDANGCSITRNVSITQPTALTATTSQINISCNGGFNGSATITATGGTGAYTYLWSPSGGTAATATGLVAGTYSVLITDVNGCTLTKNVTITQPAVLAATTSQVNILCNGGSNGSTTVTATGGTGAYTYVWSPLGGTAATATGLSAGAYSVLITDANGCTLTKNVTITQPTAITATTSQTNISCNGGSNGSANVTANGGTGTYTYAWSPSGGTAATATGLVAGAYSVLITDVNGCTLTKNVTITQPAVLAANTSQINTSCNGGSNGSATVTTTGGTGAYTYLWSPSGGTATTATGLVAGAYSVLITDANGCTITQTVTITQPDALAATTTQINVGCNAGSNGEATVNVTGGSGAYTYEWLPSGGTAATATGLVAGTYTVTVTDANGCELAQSFTITEPLAIVINSQPADIDAETGDTVVFTVNADNAGTYQWQVSTNGTDWTDVTNGGTGPEFSGATTGSLIVTGVPVSYDGYLFRVLLANGTNCITESATAMLMVTNVLEAVDDDFSATVIHHGDGGIAGDVTANDFMNGTAVNDADVVITVIDNGGLTGVTIDANGNLIVPATATPGTYIITYSICDVVNAANCSQATAIVVVVPSLRVDNFNMASIDIYPNPAVKEVFITIPDTAGLKDVKVIVFDLKGREILNQPIIGNTQKIDISALEQGVYIFNITSNRGTVTKRIVKEK
ncbi:T9SS type A sorting domain-containing protein, partial [Flavobacterium subsaxonicum]